jgi:hypothetical protein
MRRGQFVLLAVLTLSGTAWAQTQVFTFESPAVVARVSSDDVVARMMSFDRNNDGKLEKGELIERMQPLVTRGDADGNGALDGTEVRALANTPPAAGGKKLFSSGSYGFADQTSLSSRSHIDESLADLRLASPAKDLASAVIKEYVDTLEATALADLLKELDGLLTFGQSQDFKSALDRQRRFTTAFSVNNAPGSSNRMVIVGGMDAGRRLETYDLAPAPKAQAVAAFEHYKARLRLRETERSELLAQMENILSPEERDNFRAALERRPVVATGGGVAFGGVVGGVVNGVGNPAFDRIFVDRMPRVTTPVFEPVPQKH